MLANLVMLRGLNTLGSYFFSIFYHGDNFSDCLFAFLCMMSLLKKGLHKNDRISLPKVRIFPFIVDLFSEGRRIF